MYGSSPYASIDYADTISSTPPFLLSVTDSTAVSDSAGLAIIPVLSFSVSDTTPVSDFLFVVLFYNVNRVTFNPRYMPQITLSVVQGNYGYPLQFSLTDAKGNLINLTGATITFSAQSTSNPAVQFSGQMAIVDAAVGVCQYSPKAADFAVAGNYSCQIGVLYVDVNEYVTFPNINIIAQPSVPVS